ncbi:MAG: hypothetical protein ABI629_17290, partial [bacterium]
GRSGAVAAPPRGLTAVLSPEPAVSPLRIAGAGLAGLTLALLVFAAVPFWALRDTCANDVLSEIASPDGSRKAVIFDRDCGATTPFSTQVSVLQTGEGLGDEPANLFAAEDKLGAAGPRVAATWRDATHLAVYYEAEARVVKAEAALGDLAISYAAIAVDATPPAGVQALRGRVAVEQVRS